VRCESSSPGRNVATKAPSSASESETADNQPLISSRPQWLKIHWARGKSKEIFGCEIVSGESEKKNVGRLVCTNVSPSSPLIPSSTNHSLGSPPTYFPRFRYGIKSRPIRSEPQPTSSSE